MYTITAYFLSLIKIMKDFKSILPQILQFTAKLTVFWLFLIVFSIIMYFAFWKPAITDISNEQTFSVDAVAKSDFAPDLATISTGSLSEGADAKALRLTADTNLKTAVNQLMDYGIPEGKIKSNYSIDPQYDKDYVSIIGYRATVTLTVETKDFSQIDKILEIAQNNHLNRVSGVYFSFEDPVAIRESLREEAIATAKAKAEKIASESGLTLGKLLNVYEGSDYSYNNYRVNSYEPVMALDSVTSSGESQKTYESFNPGETEMQMQVTLVYEVR